MIAPVRPPAEGFVRGRKAERPDCGFIDEKHRRLIEFPGHIRRYVLAERPAGGYPNVVEREELGVDENMVHVPIPVGRLVGEMDTEAGSPLSRHARGNGRAKNGREFEKRSFDLFRPCRQTRGSPDREDQFLFFGEAEILILHESDLSEDNDRSRDQQRGQKELPHDQDFSCPGPEPPGLE
jgi:hypothetical protein